jgi:hypothetical protein
MSTEIIENAVEEDKQEIRARGVIEISRLPEIDRMIEIEKLNTQGELKDHGVFDKIHQFLLLPETYKIIGVFFQPWSNYRLWAIVVESEAIPLEEEGWLPKIIPTYRRNEDGSTQLIDIKIEK